MDPLHATLLHEPASPPWWAKALYVFGVPAGIAVFLVWFLKVDVLAGQAKLQETLEIHVRKEEAEQKTLLAICLILADGDRIRERLCRGER